MHCGGRLRHITRGNLRSSLWCTKWTPASLCAQIPAPRQHAEAPSALLVLHMARQHADGGAVPRRHAAQHLQTDCGLEPRWGMRRIVCHRTSHDMPRFVPGTTFLASCAQVCNGQEAGDFTVACFCYPCPLRAYGQGFISV